MLRIFTVAQLPFGVIGHRGATTNQNPVLIMPENTQPAFREAHRQGAAIELDVMSTRDGKVVVHHDFKTGRIFKLPDQQKEVRKTTWKELQGAQFNAGEHERSMNRLMGKKVSYKSLRDFDKLQVPELETVLDSLPPDAKFYIELKTVAPFANGDLEKKVVRLIQDKKLHDRVRVLSFSPVSLRKVKLLDPKIKTALNTNIPDFVRKNPLLLKGFVNIYAKGLAGVDALQPCYAETTPELVAFSHEANMPLVAWVNKETREEEREKFPQLMAMGVDGLITNAVDLLNEEVRKQKKGG